jgi:Protein of unknown function (DUF3429)
MHVSVSPAAKIFGYAGLLPQALALFVVLSGGAWQWSALAIAYGYAALIFSFLGGIWWGIGLTREAPPRWIFAAAIAPSLIALATYLPWIWGLDWPKPSLVVLGLCICLSPLVDRAIDRHAPLPPGWMTLRWQLSLGLGILSIVIALGSA